jgi:hypothetical protein
MRRILNLFFSDNAEFTIKFIVSMLTAIALLAVSLGAQTTFTDEEMINLENDFIYLENKVDSLSYQDSLKAVMITTLEEEIKLTNEQLALTEKKVKLVKPSWYENKWLYFGYGSVLSYAVITLINQTGKIIG